MAMLPPIRMLTLLATVCLALPAMGQKADRIVIEKSQRRMTLFAGPNILRIYQIWLGTSPKGAKQQKGDHKTPEGDYVIDNHNANSNYHRALHLSYPNPQDRARAAAAHVQTGGDIMIHGLPNHTGWAVFGHHLPDWTDGCVAVTDQEIEEIYDLVPNGTRVHIQP
jgi:murein L,D-transpeptidase YafK